MAAILQQLPVDTQLLAIDEHGNEYVVERELVKHALHTDSDDWCYALKLHTAHTGCIKI